ncbi:uncharacterized protein LOC133518921 isoform X1 [Cydia pomonella]|uniref:uncharacterized protein LOC133518921 isoform X1 n=2 Tax=Cydia pomonella TaxID=82600 RepID=UPI002ADDB9A6|nr:uncharacterized protein LOC133518921 isoform X1 [Cydia pomonella]
MPQTSRKDYKNHQYSGPRKSRKRSHGQMKRYHGEIKSRTEVWCKKKKPNDDNVPSSSIVDTTVRSYSSRCNYHTEANNTKNEQHSTEKEPIMQSMDIHWPVIDPTVESHKLKVECAPDELNGLSGNRIVDIAHVLQWAFILERHRSQCEGSCITYVAELKDGFNSIFLFQCSMCKKEFRYCNENGQKLNKSFVWGTLTAGSYYTQAAHITNLMDIPTLSANKFRKIEKTLGDVWKDHLSDEIKKNGEQERAIAIQKNNVDENGIPYVSVYVDGGWPKRSYGHDFSSPSGMVRRAYNFECIFFMYVHALLFHKYVLFQACIIGKETKKCLFLGIKNKYCYHCHIYEKENKPVPEHTCFKNYEGPSTGMESAIVVEGFQRSQEMHGVLYLNFVGDGDSSVYAQLREKVSYGAQIKKTECKNHVVKTYL